MSAAAVGRWIGCLAVVVGCDARDPASGHIEPVSPGAATVSGDPVLVVTESGGIGVIHRTLYALYGSGALVVDSEAGAPRCVALAAGELAELDAFLAGKAYLSLAPRYQIELVPDAMTVKFTTWSGARRDVAAVAGSGVQAVRDGGPAALQLLLAHLDELGGSPRAAPCAPGVWQVRARRELSLEAEDAWPPGWPDPDGAPADGDWRLLTRPHDEGDLIRPRNGRVLDRAGQRWYIAARYVLPGEDPLGGVRGEPSSPR